MSSTENYNKETTEIIINCGAFQYGHEKMANVTGIESEQILKLLRDGNSLMAKLYKKGQDMFDYKFDLKLLELSQNGDLKAFEKFELRKKGRK